MEESDKAFLSEITRSKLLVQACCRAAHCTALHIENMFTKRNYPSVQATPGQMSRSAALTRAVGRGSGCSVARELLVQLAPGLETLFVSCTERKVLNNTFMLTVH